MSRGASVTRASERNVGAFEVEIETFWCDRLQRMTLGRTVPVWLTTDWTLVQCPKAPAAFVGHYGRAVELADFRADCFWVLDREGTR